MAKIVQTDCKNKVLFQMVSELKTTLHIKELRQKTNIDKFQSLLAILDHADSRSSAEATF